MFPLSLAWSLAPVLRTNTVTWIKVHILKIVSFIKRECHNSSPRMKSYKTLKNIWFSSKKNQTNKQSNEQKKYVQ